MTATIGYGAQLWVAADEAATTATVRLANLTTITPPALSVDEIDLTDMDGTDFVRSFGPGLIDPGEVALEFNWEPATSPEVLMRTMITGRQTRYMEIRFTQFSPAVVYGGRGFFKSFELGAPMDDKMTGSASLRCTELWEEI